MSVRTADLHILMLSDLESKTGAAIGAGRLASGLIRGGARVTRVVAEPDGRGHAWTTIPLRSRLSERFVGTGLQLLASRCGVRPAAWAQAMYVHQPLGRLLEAIRPSVISVNNLHSAGWWPTIVDVCARFAPTVWTLRDMWSFTGRCGYAYDCRQFLAGCTAACPTPAESPALEPRLIGGAWAMRRRLLASRQDLVAVSPSSWLAGEARAGLWKDHRIEVIPNGLPLDVFTPLDRGLARKALGVESRGTVALVCAPDLRERRKGAGLLREALRHIKESQLTILTMGHGELDATGESIRTIPLGFVDHDRTKVLAYNAADIFVHPAPVDNLPHVVMEAIACGTPVVGFRVGGIPEMVRPGRTGWIADALTVESLAGTIDRAISDLKTGVDLRSRCRAIAAEEYGLELQAARYIDLFGSMGAK